MSRPIDEVFSRLLDFIRTTWPLLYAALIAALLHFGIQKLKARHLNQERSDGAPRPVVFDEKLKKFRRIETGDQFLSVDECEEELNVENFEDEPREDDSGHASFSTDSVGLVESSSIRMMVEEMRSSWQEIEQATHSLYNENNSLFLIMFLSVFGV